MNTTITIIPAPAMAFCESNQPAATQAYRDAQEIRAAVLALPYPLVATVVHDRAPFARYSYASVHVSAAEGKGSGVASLVCSRQTCEVMSIRSLPAIVGETIRRTAAKIEARRRAEIDPRY